MPRQPGNYTHCTKCGEDLNLNPIYTNGYLRSICRLCHNKETLDRYHSPGSYKKSPEGKLRRRNYVLLERFGISLEEYNELFRLQGGSCLTCKQSCPSGNNLSVDHNHSTGEIRGLLCQNCNAAIGLLNEDQNLFMSLYDYMWETTWSKGQEALSLRPKQQDLTYKDDTRGLEWLS